MKLADSCRSLIVILFLSFIAPAGIALAQKSDNLIRPGDRWLDDRGIEIQAHGGGIIRLKKTWYWFGEDRSQTNDPTRRYVSLLFVHGSHALEVSSPGSRHRRPRKPRPEVRARATRRSSTTRTPRHS